VTDGNLDAYVVSSCPGGNNALLHATYRNNAWSGWSEVAGTCVVGTPSIIKHSGRIDMFHVGCNDHVYEQSSTDGNFGTNWHNLGNSSSLSASAGVTSDGVGDVMLVAITAANNTVQVGEWPL
jgi:hypothetical protein